MSINSLLIPEFKGEAANTRKMLERVPLDKANWKPHEKSTSIGRLATHIAEIPIWADRILGADSFNFDSAPFSTRVAKDTSELLQIHDERIKKALQLLEATTDEVMEQNWKLMKGEHVVYERPRKQMLRSFAFNHLYHHRGQLSVYLRLLNVPVPGMYGPSADER